MGKVVFMTIEDTSGSVQGYFSKNNFDDEIENIKKAHIYEGAALTKYLFLNSLSSFFLTSITLILSLLPANSTVPAALMPYSKGVRYIPDSTKHDNEFVL